jgi:hypothetical protein
MDSDAQVRLAIYQHFATTGRAPAAGKIADRLGVAPSLVLTSYQRLRAARVLFLEPDGQTIRMAPPFSGVPTQHRVTVGSVEYSANCAWDALGIPAALHQPGTVRSRCEQSLEPLHLEVGIDGPGPSSWLFHSLVPAAKWWDDLVFT